MTLYSVILTLHSLLRWVVLIVAVAAVVRAFVGWFGKREWSQADSRWGLYLSISIDLQLLLGLILYIFLSPFTKTAFQNFGAAMSNGVARFWAVEHILLMIVALGLIHAGRSLTRRADGATGKHRRAAIFYGLATLAILLAIPWPFFSHGRPLLRLLGFVWP
jgi:hypothetical protein